MKNLLFIFYFSSVIAQYNYTLQDINPNSSTYGEIITPSIFNNQITLHYFGHQDWDACTARVGQLNDLYQDLLDNEIVNVRIVAIGKGGSYENSNSNWINNTSMPILIDPVSYEVWESWGAGQRDLYFLDSGGNYINDFNITSWNYNQIYNH